MNEPTQAELHAIRENALARSACRPGGPDRDFARMTVALVDAYVAQKAENTALRDWITRSLGDDAVDHPSLYALGVQAGCSDSFSGEEREAIEAADLLMREGEQLLGRGE